MKAARTGVLLLALLGPVSCQSFVLTEPTICYFLDGFLFIYCIAATALFFREKFSLIPPIEGTEEKAGIYQELERPGNTDIYQELQPKPKKKAGRKKKVKKPDQKRTGDQADPGIPLQTLTPH